jgi:hypothetical protein
MLRFQGPLLLLMVACMMTALSKTQGWSGTRQRQLARPRLSLTKRFEFDPATTWRRRRDEISILSAMERRYRKVITTDQPFTVRRPTTRLPPLPEVEFILLPPRPGELELVGEVQEALAVQLTYSGPAPRLVRSTSGAWGFN